MSKNRIREGLNKNINKCWWNFLLWKTLCRISWIILNSLQSLRNQLKPLKRWKYFLIIFQASVENPTNFILIFISPSLMQRQLSLFVLFNEGKKLTRWGWAVPSRVANFAFCFLNQHFKTWEFQEDNCVTVCVCQTLWSFVIMAQSDK